MEEKNEEEAIFERVRRIDGTETVREYKKCGVLGVGGFASCFETENCETGRRSATKILQKESLSSQRSKMRLINEIRLHKALHHPNVVEFHHCFEDTKNVYIFLELCPNQSLQELILKRRIFTTPEIQCYLHGIVSGLRYLHSKHIIHRDLKLGNIFLGANMEVKIGDFGLATKLEFAKENKHTICGTPNFIAPEVLEGKGYHFEIDVWSIGVMLYIFYFGSAPFETVDAPTTYEQIKACKYSIPNYLAAPTAAIELIESILVSNPASRPTLEGILASSYFDTPFPLVLPSRICTKIVPSFAELNEFSKFVKVTPKKVRAVVECIEYVTEIDEVQNKLFYYETNKQSKGILNLKGSPYVVFRSSSAGFKLYDLLKGTCKEIEQDHDAALTLAAREPFVCSELLRKGAVNASFRLFEQTITPSEVPTHVCKVTIKNGCSVLLLSTTQYQLKFNNIDYIIGPEAQVQEITTKRIRVVANLNDYNAKTKFKNYKEWAVVIEFINLFQQRPLNSISAYKHEISYEEDILSPSLYKEE